MALPSGLYIIENARNRNWAIITNDNDGDDVISGTDVDTDTGHKWEVRELHNGTYLLRNQHFKNYASYRLTDDSGDRASVISIRTGDPNRWRITCTDGLYWISDLDGTRCWTLKYDHHETPITLEKYTHSDHQHWKMALETKVYNPKFRAYEKSVVSRPSTQPRPDLRRCPPPTLVFTGRRDILSKMHAYFSTDLGKRHIFVLYGLGGVGKSQILLKFIEECQIDKKPSRFSNVFFIDTTTADLRNIALVHGTGDSAEDALQWLCRKNDEWLLVFNNADDTTLNLRNYFPRSYHGNIIVTSRNSETRIHGPRSNCMVSGLTPDDAKDLLIKIAGVTEEDSDETIMLAKNIVMELGYLALAVVHDGAYISKSRCGLVRYIEMYREHQIKILDEYKDHIQTIDDYGRTVCTTWTVSFEKLSPRAATFLNICAFFHHDGISGTIFQRAAANIETRVFEGLRGSSGLTCAKDFLSSFLTAKRHWYFRSFLAITTEIRLYSLIEFDEKSEMYSIHPLVHAWTRSRVSDPTTIHECSQYVLGMSINKKDGPEDIAFRRTLLPHLDASLQGGIVTDPDMAGWLWYPYHEGDRLKEAEELGVQVTEMQKQVLGEDHPDTLVNVANLASTYWKQGRWKEAELLEVRVMDMEKRILGEEHPDTLTSMGNLASTYCSQNRWDEAEELHVKVVETRRRILGEEHPGTLMSMANLASIYTERGRWKEAEELGVRVVEMQKRTLGNEHPDTLSTMANLVLAYGDQGRWKEAEELGARVVKIRSRVLGKEHPDTLSSAIRLALTLSRQSRWREAEDLGEWVFKTSKRVLGKNHPDTLWMEAELRKIRRRGEREKMMRELGFRPR